MVVFFEFLPSLSIWLELMLMVLVGFVPGVSSWLFAKQNF